MPPRTAPAVGLSTRGRCLLAGGLATAACALPLDERDLLRIGAFAALLPLLALLMLTRTRHAVRARRTLLPARLPVDQAAAVELELSGGTLLGTLQLADAVPDAAGPAAESAPRFLVTRIPRRDGLRLRYPLRPRLRGRHRIGPLVARATDPLGLAEFRHELVGADRLTVLPRVVELHGRPAALDGGARAAGAAAARPGQGRPDVLVRPYQHGDELRRVHWRSTARHDELMVRQEERPWRGGSTVLLDRRAAAHCGRGAGASLEFAVELVASIGVHLTGGGGPVTVLTEDGGQLVGPGAGVDELLDALAAVRPSAQPELAGPLPRTGLVAVLGALGPAGLDALLAGRAGYAVLLDVATWDIGGSAGGVDVATQATALRRVGWRVVVAGAGATAAGVWAELTRPATVLGAR